MFKVIIYVYSIFLTLVLGSPIVWPKSENIEDIGLSFGVKDVLSINLLTKDVINKCAKGKTFCEELDSYPVQYLQEILNNTQYLDKSIFEKTRKDSDYLDNRRLNEETDGCQNTRMMIYPKAAMNEKEEWKLIFNFGEYNQGVEVEYCKTKRSRCKILSAPMGYSAYCKQKYLKVKLMSINDYGEKEFQRFLLPSACVCSYKRTVKTLFLLQN